MSYLELARIYLDEGGIGEATVLCHFTYRPDKGLPDLARALAEAGHAAIGKPRHRAEDIVARRLARVLERLEPHPQSHRTCWE